MDRILEPEYMDTQDEASEYEAMDHRAANQAVVDGVMEAGGAGRALDLGTGPGDIPILLAQSSDAVTHITALDAADTMLQLARTKVAKAGFSERITPVQGDVKAMDFGDGSFDLVYSNTILHHIPEPRLMLQEAWRVLAPGGTLWIRDLYRPASEDIARALVDQYVGAGSPRQRQLFFDSLHAGLTLDEAKATTAEAGIVGASVEMTSDRHYTLIARKATA